MKPVLVIKSPLRQEYLDYLDDVMYNPHPGFHSMRVQPTDYNTPAEARALTTPTNVNFKHDLASMGMNTNLPLSTTELGHTEPLMGRHVYPFQAFSMNPNMFNSGTEADLPRSYKIGRGNRPRNLQMYAFEGRDTTPQRFSNNLQTEGIIYGDVDESNIMPVFNKPVHYPDLRVAARSLFPSSGFTPDQLSGKQQSIARQMMRIGLPPVLTDEHLMIPDITDPHALDSIRDDTRQWSQNQQRLNIPTEDLLYASEPMDIAFQLLKERVSPEAKRHKLEYDKKYESTPERVKYREELNRERRRRGIYGSHDHKDISHTEGGKLTLEGEHENRARHFKDKGTLREL
jgi:hypothetical protein